MQTSHVTSSRSRAGSLYHSREENADNLAEGIEKRWKRLSGLPLSFSRDQSYPSSRRASYHPVQSRAAINPRYSEIS